jgi:hypothetical protein
MYNKKTAVIALLLIGLMLSVGVVSFINSPQEQVTETVCYPAVNSIQNGKVVEIQPRYCEEVEA